MEILFRLILEGKVVGYERHHKRIANKSITVEHRRITEDFANICEDESVFIPHDRKDLWTQDEDKNGRKVFYRDRVIVCGKHEDVVDWACGCFIMRNQIERYEWSYQTTESIEVIGIEGVTE